MHRNNDTAMQKLKEYCVSFWEQNGFKVQIIKYLYILILLFSTFFTTKNIYYICYIFLEILVILSVTNFILFKNKLIAYLFNYTCLFIINANIISLIFRGSFISLTMIENLHSVQALSGNFSIYVSVILVTLFFTFIPPVGFRFKILSHSKLLAISFMLQLVLTSFYGNKYSVLYNTYSLADEKNEKIKLLREIDNSENVTADFYKQNVTSYIEKPSSLPEHPNVILIFTEGLSQHIINDERQIMPNLAKFQKESLSFNSYYNHTFATYRGIISQLYSGYQLEDNDKNTLTSLQSILSLNGYQTTFLNSEPNNRQFTEYLNNMGFDAVKTKVGQVNGYSNTLSDKESYELLFDTITEQSKTNRPFFTAMYTFGTHLSLDSIDEKYGDGTNPVLNKFYDLDAQFKKFIDTFNKSSLSDNTIIIFTSDHATTVDKSYSDTFPTVERASNDLDKIPFLIYHKGIEAKAVDVGGRNSVDLVPTILDYLDISAENYFLGESLFAPIENRNLYDTIFYSSSDLLTSEENNIQALSDERKTTTEELMTKYFKAKQQTPMKTK